MQIRNYFTIILMLVSTTSYAADSIQMFASKSECLRHFTLSSGTSDVVVGDNFCKNRIVKSALEICADKKLLDFKMKNSISSVLEAQYLQKFRTECTTAQTATGATTNQQALQNTQVGERDAQIAQQKAAMTAQQQAAAASQAAKQSQGTAAQQQKEQAKNYGQAITALEQSANNYDKVMAKDAAEVKKEAAKAPAAAAATAASGAAEAGVVPEEGVYTDKGGNTYSVAQNLSEPDKPYITKTDATGAETVVDTIPQSAAAAKLDGAGVTKDIPALAGPIQDSVAKADIKPDVNGGESEITAATVEKTTEVKSEVTTTITSTNSALNIYVYASKEKFNFTPPKLEAFKAKYETFSSTIKPTCAKLAETSSFLCVEAPGAKGAKALMDAAGPILAAVTSIQKACSNTAKVTDFAAKAMTIAKATCTAAKLACDGGCAVADTAVKAMQAELKVIEGSITADKSQAAGQCEMECEMKATSECSSATIAFMACYTPALAACNTPCQADVVAKDGKARAALKTLSAAIAKESLPAPPGSVAATQVKCQMNAKDIIGLATSALSLMNARNSAEECDKKLAAGGAAGGAVTPTQYCETPGNSGTQFCKCQQNANQEGCPGFAGKGLLIDKDAAKAGVAGINLKTGKGLSSFAGGTRGTGAGFGNGSGEKNATNGSDPSTAEKLALAGGDAAASNGGGGGSTSGGGSSAGGGAGEGSGGKPDSKKWSFGSFANALGGMFGGGSGGKNSNAKGNGNLNSKQEAAIKRKLASDKLAGEITSASGKSNWEKVHQVYLIKDNTLLTGN